MPKKAAKWMQIRPDRGRICFWDFGLDSCGVSEYNVGRFVKGCDPLALLHVDFYSHVLMMDMQMDVILPETTRGQIGMEGQAAQSDWKTLYLLHGMSDDHTIWQRRTSIERYASEKGIAVVMPTTHLGWYTDMQYGPKYFTFISEELPRICRQFFPKLSPRREDTYAAGLSMGGYGALKCGLRAPHVFSKVGCLSAGFLENIDGRNSYWSDIFGPANEYVGSYNDLFAAAKELPVEDRPDVYIWCGTEDFLHKQNIKMRNLLKKLGYNMIYQESHGDHQWKYWDAKIQTILNWLVPEEEEA